MSRWGVSAASLNEVSSAAAERGGPLDIATVERQLSRDSLSGSEFYSRLAEGGLAYGPAYQRVRRISASGQDAFAEIAAGPHRDPGSIVDPAVLDAALHTALLPVLGPKNGLISARIDRVAVHLAGKVHQRGVVDAVHFRHGAAPLRHERRRLARVVEQLQIGTDVGVADKRAKEVRCRRRD